MLFLYFVSLIFSLHQLVFTWFLVGDLPGNAYSKTHIFGNREDAKPSPLLDSERLNVSVGYPLDLALSCAHGECNWRCVVHPATKVMDLNVKAGNALVTLMQTNRAKDLFHTGGFLRKDGTIMAGPSVLSWLLSTWTPNNRMTPRPATSGFSNAYSVPSSN